ncbi:MAG: hypothetical protein Rhims3KO_10310 [Hyphomicrobiales bacterium]
MADEEDLKELENGNDDLINRDFRRADLTKRTITARDFSKAKLSKADISGSDLSKSIFLSADIAHLMAVESNLEFAHFGQMAVTFVNFTAANLRNTNFEKSLFTNTRSAGADLRGANFSAARISEGCDFTNVIVDDRTKFDGVEILRPLARATAFKNYYVERGVLIRREESTPDSRTTDIIRLVDELLNDFSKLTEGEIAETRGLIGHNNPPTDFALAENESEETRHNLEVVRDEFQAAEPDSSRLKDAVKFLAFARKKILAWISRQTQIASDEFSKEFGKTLGGKTALIVAYVYFSGNIDKLLNLIQNFIGI